MGSILRVYASTCSEYVHTIHIDIHIDIHIQMLKQIRKHLITKTQNPVDMASGEASGDVNKHIDSVCFLNIKVDVNMNNNIDMLLILHISELLAKSPLGDFGRTC